MHIKGMITRDPDKYSLWDKIILRGYDCFLYELYEYSWLYKLRWKITHFLRQTNKVRTGLSVDYHDKPELMKGALFTFIEDYIAKDAEDAMSNVVIEGDLRASIIDILHFYRVRSPAMEKQQESLLHQLYGGSEFVQIKDSHHYEFKHKGNYTEEERGKMHKEHDDIEKKYCEETQKILKECVEIREYLWS